MKLLCHNKASSYLGLLICLLILAIAYSSVSIKITRPKDTASLKKLQQFLHIARQQAIKLQTTISLCPSIDNHQCSTNWSNNFIIIDKQTSRKINEFTLAIAINALELTTPMITFTPLGTTYNNGHICLQQNCLYINKAGKTYIKKR